MGKKKKKKTSRVGKGSLIVSVDDVPCRFSFPKK